MLPITLITNFAASCSTGGGFFGFPSWYQYLPSVTDNYGKCVPQINSVSDIWLIVAAVINMLLYVAALIAIGFIVYAGVQFITSHGEPDKVKKARDTIWDALIGLGITIVATSLVTFIASRFN